MHLIIIIIIIIQRRLHEISWSIDHCRFGIDVIDTQVCGGCDGIGIVQGKLVRSSRRRRRRRRSPWCNYSETRKVLPERAMICLMYANVVVVCVMMLGLYSGGADWYMFERDWAICYALGDGGGRWWRTRGEFVGCWKNNVLLFGSLYILFHLTHHAYNDVMTPILSYSSASPPPTSLVHRYTHHHHHPLRTYYHQSSSSSYICIFTSYYTSTYMSLSSIPINIYTHSLVPPSLMHRHRNSTRRRRQMAKWWKRVWRSRCVWASMISFVICRLWQVKNW